MSKRRTLQLSEGMTGTVIATILTAAPTGWLMFNGDTVGSAASAATRASDDHKNLFLALWNSFANTEAPVSGGRGASAAADWSANKTITLPDLRGRSIIGTGTGSGLTARTHGVGVGTETHALAEAELPAHAHTTGVGSTDTRTGIFGTTTTGVPGSATCSHDLLAQAPTSATRTGNTGSGTAHNNMQPSLALNWIVKI